MNYNLVILKIKLFFLLIYFVICAPLLTKTIEKIKKPRCAMPDVPNVIYLGKWNQRHLTYKFTNYSLNNEWSESKTHSDLLQAMKLWTQVTDITTERVFEGNADIEISFVGVIDDVPTNETGASFGYAYAPTDGNIYFFDEDYSGYYLEFFQIATHEIGHSLGLPHDDNNNSVMYKYFNYRQDFKLHSNDITKIQDLYGKKYSPCEHGNITAAFHPYIGTTFIIRKNQCWLFVHGLLTPGYPKLLSDQWPGVPHSVTAAYFYDDRYYFICGKDVYMYNGNSTEFIFSFEVEFDAGVVFGTSLYTFKGDQYWKYDIADKSCKPVLKKTFPRKMSTLWKDVPENIDAVYYDEPFMVFFKGDKFYEFNTATKKVAKKKSVAECYWCQQYNKTN